MKKITEKATALNLFEEAAIKHAEATELGDFKAGNKYYSIIEKAVAFLNERDETLALLNFLNHTSIGVKLWAASYLLPIQEDAAVQALEQIAHKEGIHAFTAKTTLIEWQQKKNIVK